MQVNLSSISPEEFSAIASEIADHKGLRDVLAWAATKPNSELHPQIVAEVITQDEFTHDVIIPYKDVFLVYDTT
jgi:hypothetical protein